MAIIKESNEFIIASNELLYQNEEKEKQIAALLIANKKLQEQQELFASIVNSSDDAILSKSLDGIITGWNNGAEKILGYSAKEIIGKHISIIIPSHLQNEENEIIKRIRNGELVNHYKTERVRKDGKVINLSLTISPIKDLGGNITGASKIARDITEQKKSEEEIIKSLRETSDYKYALDQSSIVSITDEKGVIKYANNNFCKAAGYTLTELLGQDHRIVNSGYHHKKYIKHLWDTISSGKIWHGEFCNKKKDGTIYWVDATIIPFLKKDDTPYQYLAIRSNITNRKKAEVDLKLMGQEILAQKINEQKHITHAIISAQERERAFLGEELHDNINQILATSKLYLDVAINDKKLRKDIITESRNYIMMGMEEIRKLSKSLTPPSLGQVSLLDALNEMIENINEARKFNFIKDWEGIDETLLSEKLKLAIFRIVQEQLNNIIKYSQAETVIIHLKQKNGTLELEIKDDGIGFDTTAKIKGIGLKNIENRAQLYDGNVEITSSPGNGCAIRIIFKKPVIEN